MIRKKRNSFYRQVEYGNETLAYRNGEKKIVARFKVRVFVSESSRWFNSRRSVALQETTDLSVAGGHRASG